MTSLETLIGVFENALDSVEIADPSGRYLYVNAAFEKLTGFSAAESVGRTPRELLRSDEHPPAFYEAIWSTIASGRSTIATMVSRRKDGVCVTHELSITSYRGEDGAIALYVGIRRDLTERVALEVNLRHEAALYHEMFANSPAVKLLLDPVTGAIVDANEAAVAFYGWSHDTLVSMRVDDINMHGPGEIRRALDLASRQQRSHFRFRHRVASGEARNVEIFSSPLHLDGKLRLLSILQDVTERERLEVELRRTQRMEAVGRLAGGIAHDFNNLLQVVFTSTALLSEQLEGEGSVDPHVSRIVTATERAADLTRQLLLFSRGDTSRVELFDLHAVVANATRLMQAGLDSSVRLVVEREGPTATQLPVQLVRTTFDQVLLDLVARSRHALPGGGTIRLTTSRTRLAANEVPPLESGEYARLELSDDGLAMTDERLAHAFEPFYDVDGTEGGLGLAVLYGIVQRAGGAVTVERRAPHGTTFRVFLPLVDAVVPAVQSPSSLRPAPFDGHGTTVLLVDDEPDVRDVVAMILKHHGVRVLEASDGAQALELARAHRDVLDVLLTDIVMPTMLGPEVAKHVTTICPNVRVVFMSGFIGDAWERGVPESARLLAKPFGARALIDAIREAATSRA